MKEQVNPEFSLKIPMDAFPAKEGIIEQSVILSSSDEALGKTLETIEASGAKVLYVEEVGGGENGKTTERKTSGASTTFGFNKWNAPYKPRGAWKTVREIPNN